MAEQPEPEGEEAARPADLSGPTTAPLAAHKLDFGFLPIPKRLQHNPDQPFRLSLLLNTLFALAGTFTGANLYYCQPILLQLAQTFQTSDVRIANVPTLTQAGYAAGMLLLTPLGDMIRRRELLLALLFCAGSLTLGLASTRSLVAFETLSFLAGVVAVTPQVIMPLTVDLAAPERRATAMSIVLSGIMLGILVARVLGGLIAQFSYWRNIYWMSMAIHYALFCTLFFILPDVPKHNVKMTYFQILYSMAKYAVTEPILIQSSIIGLCCNAVYASFWVTLTFLLGGAPYYYNTLDIGLFGLVGILGIAVGPFIGRAVDHLNPWFGVLFGLIGMLLPMAIDTAAATKSVGVIVVVAFFLDVFDSLQQISTASRYFDINPEARARMNAVFIVSEYIGLVIGTAVGTRIFTSYGNAANGGMNLAWIVSAIVVLLVRGPAARKWIGWGVKAESWRRPREAEEEQALEDAKPHACMTTTKSEDVSSTS